MPNVALGRVLGRLSYLLSHSGENRELRVLASFTLFHLGDSGLLFRLDTIDPSHKSVVFLFL